MISGARPKQPSCMPGCLLESFTLQTILGLYVLLFSQTPSTFHYHWRRSCLKNWGQRYSQNLEDSTNRHPSAGWIYFMPPESTTVLLQRISSVQTETSNCIAPSFPSFTEMSQLTSIPIFNSLFLLRYIYLPQCILCHIRPSGNF